MKFHLVTLILLSLLTTACSQKKSEVKLEISYAFAFGGAETADVSRGGLMVWGRSNGGASFAKAIKDKDDINLNLNNDIWRFYVMAWDGTENYVGGGDTNYPFGGKVRCAKSPDIALSGSPVAVNMQMSNDQCAAPAFSGNAKTSINPPATLIMPKLKLRFCDSLKNIAGPNDLCTDDLSIGAAKKARKAPVASYRVSLREHFSLDKTRRLEAGSISSPCLPFTSDSAEHAFQSGTAKVGFPSIPAGGPGFPMHTTVEVFLGDGNCDAVISRGPPIIYEFPHGFIEPVAGSKHFVGNNGGVEHHLAALEITPATVCNGQRLTSLDGHPFAAGNGDRHSPYIICSPGQLQAMNVSLAYFGNSFKLQSDLDFFPFNLNFGGGLLSSKVNCLQFGDNFIPLGYLAANCSGTGITWGSPTEFTGDFFGAGFKIQNLRIRADALDFIALFAKIQGTSSIQEIEFVLPSISGKSYVGALAGSISGTGVQLKDIHVTGGSLEARGSAPAGYSKVGAIAGYMLNATLTKSKIRDVRIEGREDYIGGITGYASSVTFKEISVEADIDGSMNPATDFVGGIAGYVTNSSFDFVKHEGSINANGQKIGGIAGLFKSGASFTNFYTISSIINKSSAPISSGGVIGRLETGGSTLLNLGYSLSMIRTLCPTGCFSGAIIGSTDGASPVTPAGSKLYSLDQIAQHFHPTVTPSTFSQTTMTLDNSLTPTGGPLALSTMTGWIHPSGTYPRFVFEEHPCGQGYTGSGTSIDPKTICGHQQWLDLANSNSNDYYKLEGNIRLNNHASNAQNEIAQIDGIVDGNKKMLIAGQSNYSGAGNTGHIGTLNGSIKDLRVEGMSRTALTPALSTDPSAIFIEINNGCLENIMVHGFGTFNSYAAGVVGRNNAGKTIRKVKFMGKITGELAIAGLVTTNQGTIENSATKARLECTKFTGCSQFSGVLHTNDGSIRRSAAQGSIEDYGSYVNNNVSMFVYDNQGVMEDIEVSKDAYFLIGGTNPKYFTQTNGAGATVTRAINSGKLTYNDSSFSSKTLISSWPASNGVSGIDIYRSGRAGMALANDFTFVCASLTALVISNWVSPLSEFDSWNSYLSGASPGQYGAASPGEQRIVLDIKGQNGINELVQITSISGNTFTVSNCNAYGGSGTVTIYWSSDLPANSYVMAREAGKIKSNYGTIANSTWDVTDAGDMSQMANYYTSVVNGAPVIPAVWELDVREGHMQLFESHD
ncbi:MAG TPA: hypothetical protein VNJ08_11075 [Bacteriovoracaceae bacterium]|nr:hypothetical protein [Bacteriovoracaceae bacterium]